MILLSAFLHYIQKWNKASAIFRNLPEYVDKIKELEKEIKALKEK